MAFRSELSGLAKFNKLRTVKIIAYSHTMHDGLSEFDIISANPLAVSVSAIVLTTFSLSGFSDIGKSGIDMVTDSDVVVSINPENLLNYVRFRLNINPVRRNVQRHFSGCFIENFNIKQPEYLLYSFWFNNLAN